MSLESRLEYTMRCDRCNNCKWVPGIPSQAHAGMCPSIEYGNFHSYSGGGKNITAHAVIEQRIKEFTPETLRSVYACSACGACDTACQWNHVDAVSPLDTMYELRAKIAEDGASLPEHKDAIESLRNNGNRYGKPASDRSRWSEDLALPDILTRPAKVLLHIGSDNAYDKSQWSELKKIVELLQTLEVDFAVLGNAEPDDGGYAFDIGFQEDAKRCAQKTAEAIAQSKASHVVTCSAAAFSAFKNVYPRLGVKLGDIKVEHITQVMEKLLAEKANVLSKSRSADAVSYHDSCKLGRLGEAYPEWNGKWTKAMNIINVTEPERATPFGNKGIYDAPRRLMDQVTANRVELQRNRQFSYCCGGLGGGKEAYPDFAKHAARERLEEVRTSGASTVVSACGACTSHLREVAQETDPDIRVMGLFEFLSEPTKDGESS